MTPEEFWNFYKREIRQLARRNAYLPGNGVLWTAVALEAAENVMHNWAPPLSTQREYLRVDAIGYEQLLGQDGQVCGRVLRVAFEHENTLGTWHSELCKLCHVMGNLRVLVSYHNFKNGKPPIIEQLSQELNQLERHENLVTRWHGKWLFAFGPHRIGPQSGRHPFVAFTLNGVLPQLIDEAEQLYPDDFPA